MEPGRSAAAPLIDTIATPEHRSRIGYVEFDVIDGEASGGSVETNADDHFAGVGGNPNTSCDRFPIVLRSQPGAHHVVADGFADGIVEVNHQRGLLTPPVIADAVVFDFQAPCLAEPGPNGRVPRFRIAGISGPRAVNRPGLSFAVGNASCRPDCPRWHRLRNHR
jgi:hypothetical protein